jgi:hypothetical protein
MGSSAAHNDINQQVVKFPITRSFPRLLNQPGEFARFVILSPPLRGLEMVLKPQPRQRHWTLGSATGVDFYIRDPSLLGVHLMIERVDDVWMMTSHEDCWGFRVNNEPVETAVVEHGDRVSVGRFDLVFLDGLNLN